MYNVLMKRQTLRGEQEGFAALVIAITLVVIVGLISVGFAQLMRREITQATGKQLANQAYYAAESGVNDAVAALNNGYVGKKTSCDPIVGPKTLAEAYLSKNDVDSTNSEWTCLLIDSAPGTLKYSPVDQVNPTAFVARAVDPSGAQTNFTSLTVSWEDADQSSPQKIRSTSGVGNVSFPPAGGAWDAIGVVRISITPIGLGAVDRATLQNNTFTAYLYPTTTASNNTFTYTNVASAQGVVMDGKCSPGNTPLRCSVTINGGGGSAPRVLISLRSIYSDTKVFISANGGADNLADAQSLVDSTGRAQDVLKRIQVRIPNRNSFYYPGFTLETIGNACKQLRVRPGFSDSGGC
ncbi:MAG: hypothetical protein JWO41_37 [Candidatus Saccharibacteria bacterium]|nr:hypothetical protein [Candidatus Saccharibacteria bacterium]